MKALRLLPMVALAGVLSLSNMSPTVAVVPEKMMLDPLAQSSDWSTTSLIPLDFAIGVQELTPAKSAMEVISQHSGDFGSIVFVVRRPG